MITTITINVHKLETSKMHKLVAVKIFLIKL
jgi:hypothetical protein